jgi:2,5-diketo-D-gluconate reductase A
VEGEESESMVEVPNIRLNNGVEIPQFGFGVFQIPPAETARVVRTALDAGYRHIDTAQGYGNEEGVGQAVRESGLARDEVFITTKLGNSRHGDPDAALDESLKRLGTDQVDLFLIHWPRPAEDRYVEAWRGLERLAADGRARAIGVSNFQVPHLRRLAAETGTVPAVNQIELHPRLTQVELREYHREHGIATEAWSPLAKCGDLLRDQRLLDLADRYDRTPAQVVLRWHVQHGLLAVAKSEDPERQRQNIRVFDFELSPEEIAALDALDRGEAAATDSDAFGH